MFRRKGLPEDSYPANESLQSEKRDKREAERRGAGPLQMPTCTPILETISEKRYGKCRHRRTPTRSRYWTQGRGRGLFGKFEYIVGKLGWEPPYEALV